MPPSDGDRHLGPNMNVEALEQMARRFEAAGVIVVASDQQHRDPLGHEPGEELVHEALRLHGRRGGVEDVAAHEDRIDLRFDRDARHLVESRRVLGHTIAASQRLADVPVGGVEKSQRDCLGSTAATEARRHSAASEQPKRQPRRRGDTENAQAQMTIAALFDSS